MTKSLLYFVAAGLCEIGGGYLVWLWLRENKPIWFGVFGAVILVLYGVIPTFQPTQFEIVTSERAWDTKTADLKWADLEPYSPRDTAFIRLGIAVFIGAAVVLCALGYFMLGR